MDTVADAYPKKAYVCVTIQKNLHFSLGHTCAGDIQHKLKKENQNQHR